MTRSQMAAPLPEDVAAADQTVRFAALSLPAMALPGLAAGSRGGSREHEYMRMLRTNGTHILVGAPPKPVEVGVFTLMGQRRSVASSGIGGLPETQEMLDYCAEHNIVSDIEMIDIKDIHNAYERMEKGDVRYRFVIDMKSL